MKIPKEVYAIDLYDENKESNEILLEVFCTDKCNYNCYYCINLKFGYVRKNKQLDLNQLYDFIIWLNKISLKRIHLILIGGEPTLHSEFISFCKKTSILQQKNILIIEAFTNLSQSKEFYIKTIRYGISYKISFHYSNDLRTKSFIDKLLSLKDNYINGIDQIFIMCEPINFNKSINVFSKLHNVFQKKVMCCLIDDADKNNLIANRENQYSKEQLTKYKNVCINNDLHNIFNILYDDGSKEIKSLYYIKNTQSLNFKLWKCNAGKDFFSIDFDGNIHSCSMMKGKILAKLNDFKCIKLKPCICCSSICCNYELLKQRIF